MILFHGTSRKRGEQILEEEKLKIDAQRVYDDSHLMPTSSNCISLTNDLANAICYGNKTAHNDGEMEYEIIIFELDIPEHMLKPDLDEFKYTIDFAGGIGDQLKYNEPKFSNPTVEESLKITKSVWVTEDIHINKFCNRYTILPSTKIKNLEKDDTRELVKEIISMKNPQNDYAKGILKECLEQIPWKDTKKP